MSYNISNTLIPVRSQPGITMTAPTVRHREVGEKYATGLPKKRKLKEGRISQLEHGM